jgi:hypothetical protein
MNMYWVYDLQSWQFGVLTVALLVSVSLSAFVLSRNWIRKRFRLSDATNEPVSGFFFRSRRFLRTVAGTGCRYGVAER